jgi:hypothetical protein
VAPTLPGPSKHETDEGVRVIKIEGCDYRIPGKIILEFLSHYEEVLSEVMENLFDDGGILDSEAHGTNRSGIYSVKIKLAKDIPQLVPILGRRVKIQYKGIRRMCTNCIGQHPKQACRSQKLEWVDHVSRFSSANKDIRDKIIKRPDRGLVKATQDILQEIQVTSQAAEDWVNSNTNVSMDTIETRELVETEDIPGSADEIQTLSEEIIHVQDDIEDEQVVGPSKAAFLVPANKAEHDEMIRTLVKAGIGQPEAEQVISLRKTAYNKACKDFKKIQNKVATQTQKIAKRSSKQSNKSQDANDN